MVQPIIKADAGEFAVENLIRSTYESIQRIKADRKKKKEMIESALLNDDAYRQLSEEHKKLGTKKSGARARIMLVPATKKLNEEIKDMTSELKDMKEALSAYVAEYKKQTGSDTIEMTDGRTYRFAVAYQLALFEKQRKAGKKGISKKR